MSVALDTLKNVYRLMTSEDAVLVYAGEFDQEIIKSMLKYTEDKLESSGVDDLVRRKIFNVMVEMLQNITKHQFIGGNKLMKSIFILIEKDEDFHLITGNPINISVFPEVSGRIDKINAMDADDLKAFYKETRLASRISEVGGAGLGFIDMARKSGNKLDYEIHDIDADEYKYFTLKTRINKNN